MLAPLVPAATADTAAPVLVRHEVRLSGPGLDADGDGAWVVGPGGITRVALDGTATVELGWGSNADLIALDGGKFVALNAYSGNVRKVSADSNEPVMAKAFQYALGPGGALHAAAYDGKGFHLVRLEPETRTPTVLAPLPTNGLLDIAFAPSGDLFVAHGGNVSRYDATTGSFVTAYSAASATAIAFDAAGHLYVAARGASAGGNVTTLIVRVDLDTGEATKVLDLGRAFVHNLAFGGSRLYMVLHEYAISNTARLAHVELGIPGFEGFTGSLPLPPAGDLAVTDIVVERERDFLLPFVRNDVNERRTIVVTVTNVGPGPIEGSWAGDIVVYGDSLGGTATTLASRVANREGHYHKISYNGSIESGASVTFRVPWDVTTYAGQFRVGAGVDTRENVLELEEWTNNWKMTTAVVRTTL